MSFGKMVPRMRPKSGTSSKPTLTSQMPITPLRKRFRSSKRQRKTRAAALQAMKTMTLTTASMITSKKYRLRTIKRTRHKVIK